MENTQPPVKCLKLLLLELLECPYRAILCTVKVLDECRLQVLLMSWNAGWASIVIQTKAI